MCGICGFVSLKPVKDGERILQRMVEALRHRGPDAFGVLMAGDAEMRRQGETGKESTDSPLHRFTVSHPYIGHTRLAIIDLSEAGKQPMPNEDGTVWVTYNGEIYNFLELRSLLEQKGHRFRSRTDTEVLVHAYEEWGDNFITKLRGMFAFAVWDNGLRTTGPRDNGTTGQRESKAGTFVQWSRGQLSNGRLLLARDRLGIKPLYYAHLPDGSLVFASELRAILEHPQVSREIAPLAVDAYFAYGYIPAPLTIYRVVRKLPPAHYLVWQDGQITLHRCCHEVAAIGEEAVSRVNRRQVKGKGNGNGKSKTAPPSPLFRHRFAATFALWRMRITSSGESNRSKLRKPST